MIVLGNKATNTWPVEFDNRDTDEYTYIELSGAKQLFGDKKDREEGDEIVSVVSAVKSQTKTNTG